jgi:hypothetical protein
MKKSILLTLLIFSSFQTITSQEKHEKDLITSGKWHIEYMQMGGKKMDLPAQMQKMNWVLFHKDGKQEGMENGQKYVGKWEFDKKNRIIKTNDLDGIAEQKLISVTKKKLIVSVKDQGSIMIMGMKKH